MPKDEVTFSVVHKKKGESISISHHEAAKHYYKKWLITASTQFVTMQFAMSKEKVKQLANSITAASQDEGFFKEVVVDSIRKVQIQGESQGKVSVMFIKNGMLAIAAFVMTEKESFQIFKNIYDYVRKSEAENSEA